MVRTKQGMDFIVAGKKITGVKSTAQTAQSVNWGT